MAMNTNDPRSKRASPSAVVEPEDAGRVTVVDLQCVDDISMLLRSFGDPKAGADLLAKHIVKIRVLKVRISQRFTMRYPNRPKPDVAGQVALLGNRELEAILLELLEDVVTLASEVGSTKT